MTKGKPAEQVWREMGFPPRHRVHAVLCAPACDAASSVLDLIAKIWPHAYIEMNDDEGYDRPLADRAKIDPNEVDLKFYKDKSVFDFFSGEKYNCERLQAINFHTEPNHFVLAWDEDPTHELEHIAESICFYLSLLGMIQLDKDDSSIEIPSMLKPILELVEEKKQTLACAS